MTLPAPESKKKFDLSFLEGQTNKTSLFSDNFMRPSAQTQFAVRFEHLTAEQLSIKMAKMLGQFSSPAFYPKVRRTEEFFLERTNFLEKINVSNDITYPNMFEPHWVQKVIFSERVTFLFAVTYLMVYGAYLSVAQRP